MLGVDNYFGLVGETRPVKSLELLFFSSPFHHSLLYALSLSVPGSP